MIMNLRNFLSYYMVLYYNDVNMALGITGK